MLLGLSLVSLVLTILSVMLIASHREKQLRVGNQPQMTETVSTAAPTAIMQSGPKDYPTCSDAKDMIVGDDNPTLIIQLHEDCWSGAISGLSNYADSWKNSGEIRAWKAEGSEVEFLFQSGERKLVRGPETIELPNHKDRMRQWEWVRARGKGDLRLWASGIASMPVAGGPFKLLPMEGTFAGYGDSGFILRHDEGERTYRVSRECKLFGSNGEQIGGECEAIPLGARVRLRLERNLYFAAPPNNFLISEVHLLEEKAPPPPIDVASETNVEVVDHEEENLRVGSSLYPQDLLAPQPIGWLRARVVSKSPSEIGFANDTRTLRIKNESNVEVIYKGSRYRLANLEVGDVVDIYYLRPKESNALTRATKIEVVRSSRD